MGPRDSISWLTAFAALEAGDDARAHAALAAYLDSDRAATPPLSRALLLQLWDQDAALDGPVPSYTHPTLPPSLTGLPRPVTRLPHLGPVLATTPPEHNPTMQSVNAPHLLAVATEW